MFLLTPLCIFTLCVGVLRSVGHKWKCISFLPLCFWNLGLEGMFQLLRFSPLYLHVVTYLKSYRYPSLQPLMHLEIMYMVLFSLQHASGNKQCYNQYCAAASGREVFWLRYDLKILRKKQKPPQFLLIWGRRIKPSRIQNWWLIWPWSEEQDPPIGYLRG